MIPTSQLLQGNGCKAEQGARISGHPYRESQGCTNCVMPSTHPVAGTSGPEHSAGAACHCSEPLVTCLGGLEPVYPPCLQQLCFPINTKAETMGSNLSTAHSIHFPRCPYWPGGSLWPPV